MEQYRIDMMKKIQTIVLEDMHITDIEQLDRINRQRFNKQCTRLLEACMICPSSKNYILERYEYEFIKHLYKDIP